MQIEQNIPLAPFTTLHIGGPARYFARATSEDELLEAVRFARTHSLPLFVLGGGSNLLVSDSGFPGLVIKVALDTPIQTAVTPNHTTYTVPAGHDWDAFVQTTCQDGFFDLACLAGIPGTVGASPVQNIGAYGQEVSHSIYAVHAFYLNPAFEKPSRLILFPEDLRFSYRASIFNAEPGRYLITSVEFRLSNKTAPPLLYADLKRYFEDNPNPTPQELAKAVRQIRLTKGMYLAPGETDPDFRSAGSFFKNPVVSADTFAYVSQTLAIDPAGIPHWPAPDGQIKLAAAWLIEKAGFPKGYVQGQAAISSRHTLALVNHSDHATCADLTALRDTITQRILARFGITLHQEPVIVG